MNEINFSIIIVNYNSGGLLLQCIDSVVNNLTGTEVIIYDNASADDSILLVRNKYPQDDRVKIVEGDTNLGFAAGNNRAAELARGKYLHFLNPDIIVNGTLAADYLKIEQEGREKVWVTSLRDEPGNLQKNRHLIPLFGNYFNRMFCPSRAAYWNIGASVIMSKSIFQRIGGWPEDYFMYAEDLDLFYRIHLFRIPVEYLDTRITHLGRGTTRSVWNDEQRAMIIERSFRKFYKKYGHGFQYLLIRPVLLLYGLILKPRDFIFQTKIFIKSLKG